MFNLMIINNQSLTRKTLIKILEESKMAKEIITKNTIDEGLSYLDKNSVDVIILEVSMQNSKFVNFIEKIKLKNKKIKIFLLSRDINFTNIYKINFDFNDIIKKPISEKDIKEKLVKLSEESININIDDFLTEFNIKLKERDFLKSLDILKTKLKEVCLDKSSKLQRKKLEFVLEKILIKEKIGNINLSNYFSKNMTNSKILDIIAFEFLKDLYQVKACKDFSILEDVFIYINNNIYKNISLNDIVKNCAISQAYLSRLFRSNFKITVVNYINLLKINIGKEIIINEEMTMVDLSNYLSYSDYSYFSKVFKKHEGMTIENYKKT